MNNSELSTIGILLIKIHNTFLFYQPFNADVLLLIYLGVQSLKIPFFLGGRPTRSLHAKCHR